MKKLLLLLLLCGCAAKTEPPDIVAFRVSKPYCLLNFIEAASGNADISETLRQYISNGIPHNDTAFAKLVTKYRDSINLRTSYMRNELPDSRRRGRVVFDIVANAAAKSEDIEEFSKRIDSLLPAQEHQRLVEVLREAEGFYNSIVWNEYSRGVYAQLDAFKVDSKRLSGMFDTLRRFYGSAWSRDTPFTVNVYPIPGTHGISTATAHGSVLSVGMLTGEDVTAGKVSVVVHEMCHVLYDSQPATMQHKLAGYFNSSSLMYKQLAYSYIDEALATACGNGWVYRSLTGELDTGDWYNNEYINGYAKAIYPLVNDYIESGKVIDSSFIAAAIDVFAEVFPRSVYNYSVLFNDVDIYHDGSTQSERKNVMNSLAEYFQVYKCMVSTPISDEKSLEYLRSGDNTQLIIINNNHAQNMNLLQEHFPEVNTYLKEYAAGDFYLSFIDRQRRPVVIACVYSDDLLKRAFMKIKEQRFIDTSKPFVALTVE